jgi:CheY-like chemotaxis protein
MGRASWCSAAGRWSGKRWGSEYPFWKHLPVLVAEDEETDGFILRLGFERAGLPNPLLVVRDGQEALDYLIGNAPYADRSIHPLPALLLLDLKMPRMNGFEVLAWLATRPDFKDLPAVVLSSSSDDSDIQKARQMGARDYFVKPHSLSDLVKILQRLHTRWLPVMPNQH